MTPTCWILIVSFGIIIGFESLVILDKNPFKRKKKKK